MKRKIALVLSGGGLKGYFQASAITELRNAGLTFDYIAGISIGSINGVFEAMDRHADNLTFWDRVIADGVGFAYTSDFINLSDGHFSPNLDAIIDRLVPKLSLLEKVGLLSKKNRKELIGRILSNAKAVKGLADNTPLLNLLQKQITREKLQVPFSCGAVSLTDGNYYCLSPWDFADDENFVRFVLASSNMPIVWPPVPEITLLGGQKVHNLVDGGLRNISPLGDAARYIENDESDADEWLVVVINCGTGYVKPDESEMNLLGIANRALNDIALSEVFQNDIDQFLRINDLVTQSSQPLKSRSGRVLRKYDVMLIQPDEDSLGDTLDASKDIMQKRAYLGREKALAALDWGNSKQLL